MTKLWTNILAILVVSALLLTGCGNSATPSGSQEPQETSSAQELAAAPDISESSEVPEDTTTEEEVTILIAAAASLRYSFDDALIPMFEEKYPHIKVTGTYDASGKLQTQIEEGLEADVFMSADTKRMNNLKEASLVDVDTIVELLENRIVLIAHVDSDTTIDSFEKIGEAEAIALGDPDSVPVGTYAKEALTTLGLYDSIQPKVSLGNNVTQVLNWVAAGNADVGIVYATDAAMSDEVKILAETPAGSLAEKVIYPVAVVSASQKKEAAQLFVDFLSSPEALAVFESYGYTINT